MHPDTATPAAPATPPRRGRATPGAVRVAVGWAILLVAALVILLLGLGAQAPPAPASAPAPAAPLVPRTELAFRRAEFGGVEASAQTRQVADWVAASGDHGGRPFILVDKRQARLFLFDAGARLHATTPVLLGAAPGDDTVPGIGARPLAEMLPAERTTPAGRFVGERGHNAAGQEVVWVDYDAAVSMHRVVTSQPHERRLARLATTSLADKRISYGCINVPAAFFDDHIRPVFALRRALIYVLPEQKSLQQVFGPLQRAAALGTAAPVTAAPG